MAKNEEFKPEHAEAIGEFNRLEGTLQSLGLEYNLQLTIGLHDDRPHTMLGTSDPVYKQRSIQAAKLTTGESRLIDFRHEITPHGAVDNPGNARICNSRTYVNYLDGGNNSHANSLIDELAQLVGILGDSNAK